jgi:ribonucleoside-diphosphate reductase beta chain
VNLTKTILDPTFEIDATVDKQAFLLDVIGYFMIMKGVFFYAGFAMLLQLMRNNKMKGIGEQFQYILRDESIHIAYGRDLINGIVAENPEIWTEEFKYKAINLFKQATLHELAYVEDCLPFGTLGLKSDAVKQYVHHIVDRRCEMINLPILYGDENPFPWMNEIIDLKKEKNFFEKKVFECQTVGSLEW